MSEIITRKDLNNAYRMGREEGRLAAHVIDGQPSMSVHEYVGGYEFRGDQDYTPTDHERALIEDAINGYLGLCQLLTLTTSSRWLRHASDCAVHNAPAFEPGPCDCGASTVQGGLTNLADATKKDTP